MSYLSLKLPHSHARECSIKHTFTHASELYNTKIAKFLCKTVFDKTQVLSVIHLSARTRQIEKVLRNNRREVLRNNRREKVENHDFAFNVLFGMSKR